MTQQKLPKAQKTSLTKPQDVQAILEERARSLARLPEKKVASGETLEVLTFHLGTEYIGIPTEGIHEIQPLSAHHWSRVPCAPDFIVGIVNLRSRVYSIMDLTVLWGLPPRPLSEKAHILLVRGGHRSGYQEMELTLLTDDLDKVCRLRLDDLNPMPPTVSAKVQAHVRGVTPNMMMVIDLESLLSDPQIIVCEGE
jgi:purine-binding chemotaxis protein CheW